MGNNKDKLQPRDKSLFWKLHRWHMDHQALDLVILNTMIFPFAAFILWFFFSIPYGVLTVVALWIITTIAYVSFSIYYMRKDRKKG